MKTTLRGWLLPIPSPTIEAMESAADIAVGDVVELTTAIDAAPAGARGGVTDLLDDDNVVVEVTTLPLEPILDRIVIVPPSKLRVIESIRARA